MAKKQIHIRASNRLQQQLEELATGGATITEVVTVAVDRMYREETNLYYTIDDDKLAEVMRIINRDTDPAATEEILRTEICADWNEGQEHQEWLDTATAEEIADWLASFYQEN